LKRTRRIEVVRYTRRVTLSGADNAPDRAEGPALDILLEALGDAATIPEEFRHEAGAGLAGRHRAPLLRRLLRLPPVRGCFPFRSGDENPDKENEPLRP
jgi:hypothetical protein